MEKEFILYHPDSSGDVEITLREDHFLVEFPLVNERRWNYTQVSEVRLFHSPQKSSWNIYEIAVKLQNSEELKLNNRSSKKEKHYRSLEYRNFIESFLKAVKEKNPFIKIFGGFSKKKFALTFVFGTVTFFILFLFFSYVFHFFLGTAFGVLWLIFLKIYCSKNFPIDFDSDEIPSQLLPL